MSQNEFFILGAEDSKANITHANGLVCIGFQDKVVEVLLRAKPSLRIDDELGLIPGEFPRRQVDVLVVKRILNIKWSETVCRELLRIHPQAH